MNERLQRLLSCDCPINFWSEEVLAVPQQVWRSERSDISNFQMKPKIRKNILGQFQEKRRKVFFGYFSSTFLDFYNIKTFHKKGGEKQSVGVPSATWLGTSLVSSWKESPTRKAPSQKETQIHYNFLNVWSQMEYITAKEGTNLGQIHRTHVFNRRAVAIFTITVWYYHLHSFNLEINWQRCRIYRISSRLGKYVVTCSLLM